MTCSPVPETNILITQTSYDSSSEKFTIYAYYRYRYTEDVLIDKYESSTMPNTHTTKKFFETIIKKADEDNVTICNNNAQLEDLIDERKIRKSKKWCRTVSDLRRDLAIASVEILKNPCCSYCGRVLVIRNSRLECPSYDDNTYRHTTRPFIL